MKNGIINAFLVLVSILLSLLIAEALARVMIEPRSSPIGYGILHRKFQSENLKVNSEGYRDSDFSDKNKNASNIFFIGDSFTFGHGVANDQVFPARVSTGLSPEYATYNFGISGLNTLDELKILQSKLNLFNRKPDMVVYQYVGNDIDYLVDIKIMTASGIIGDFLIWLANYSYLVDYIYQPYLIKKIIGDNLHKLYQAYHDKMHAHLADVQNIWDKIHEKNSSILFIIFPIYIDEKSLYESYKIYVKILMDRFLSTCNKKDGLINVMDIIEQHPLAGRRDYWMANAIDPHPSAMLHELVANEIINYIQAKPGKFMRCQK